MWAFVKTIPPIDMLCLPTSAVARLPRGDFSTCPSWWNCSSFQLEKDVRTVQSLHLRAQFSYISVAPRLYNPDTSLRIVPTPFS